MARGRKNESSQVHRKSKRIVEKKRKKMSTYTNIHCIVKYALYTSKFVHCLQFYIVTSKAQTEEKEVDDDDDVNELSLLSSVRISLKKTSKLQTL